MHHFTKYRHVIYCYHRYMDSQHIIVTHACMVSLFLFYVSPFILHVLLLHAYSCIPVTYCFPLLLLIFLLLIFSLLDMSVVDTRCVELSATWISTTRATSRISHLLYIVSRYLVAWYQYSSYPLIVLLVPYTVLVLDTRIMHCSSS